MRSLDDFEREMLETIDVEAIAREFGEHPITNIKPTENSGMSPAPSIKTKAESIICKKTGKVQFENALIALEALRQWKMRDPTVCWDLKHLRVYQCKKCHQFHLGKRY